MTEDPAARFRKVHLATGPIVRPDASVLIGEVVIEKDTITCVAVHCPDPPGAWVFTITAAFIFPGFIDVHNHVAYNVLPKWTPPRLYANRGLTRRGRVPADGLALAR